MPILLRDHERIGHGADDDPQRPPASPSTSEVRDALERLADKLADTLRVLDNAIDDSEGD